MNVDSLRRKRMKKLGVRLAGYSGHRRIFFVLERATRKFPGELSLWIQYLEFTKHAKANKKLLKILDEVLRLHPTKPELWIYASQHHMNVEADFAAARNCMQTGMRFCSNSSSLWLEYARLEVAYLAKIAGRRIVMGLDERPESKVSNENDVITEDVIFLPTTTLEEANADAHSADSQNVMKKEKVKLGSLWKGAIPQAIYTDAMKRFGDNPELGELFFDLFWEYRWIDAMRDLSMFVLEHLFKAFPRAPETTVCKYKFQYESMPTQSPDFPILVSSSLREIKASAEDNPAKKARLTSKFTLVLLKALDHKDLDNDIRTVILSSIRSFSLTIQNMPSENKKYGNKLNEFKAQYPSVVRYLI